MFARPFVARAAPLWARRAAAAALLAMVAASLSGGAARSADRRVLSFAARPTAVRVSPDGREVLVEFAGALPDGDAERAAKSLGPLLEGFSEGYGAVRFRLSAPAQASLAGPETVEVVSHDDVTATLDDERRLPLLQARLQARQGDLPGAVAKLERAAADRPGDIDPLLALAETQNAAGRWQHALGLYDGIGRLFPEATDVPRDRSVLAMQHAPNIRVDTTATFGPNGERGQTLTLTGDAPLSETWRAGASLQTAHDSIRGLRRSGDATPADYDGTKLLGGLSLTHSWSDPADQSRINLFAAARTVGLGLDQTVTSRFGQTSLGALYHQPYWGTVMSFAADARRDQIGFSQTVPLPDQWQAQFGAGFVRYGLPGHDSVGSGPSAVAGVSRLLPERWMPRYGMQVRLGYRLEAEYLGSIQTGPTSAGNLPLLDVRRREFHSLYGEATLPVGPGTATGLLGYVVDRFGGSGPEALIRYTSGSDSDRLAISGEAGLEPSLDVRTRTLFHVGGYLIWRFGGARG